MQWRQDGIHVLSRKDFLGGGGGGASKVEGDSVSRFKEVKFRPGFYLYRVNSFFL